MDKSLLQNLMSIVGRYHRRLLLACLMVLISNGLLILNPLIFRQALMAIDPSHPLEEVAFTSFFQEVFGSYFHSAYIWAVLLLVMALLASLFKYGMRLIFFSISREVEMDVREKLFERIQSQSKLFFDHHGIGDLLSRLSNDITAYRDILGAGIMYPLHFLSLVIPALVALFYLSPMMAAISVIPIIMIYFINLGVSRPLLRISHHMQRLLAEMSTMTHEHYSSIKLIKNYGIERALLGLFEHLCRLFGKLNIRFASFQGLYFPILVFVTKLSMLSLALATGAIVLLNWGAPISLADFLSFLWIQSYIFSALMMLAWIIPMYQKGQAAYARLLEIYEEPIEVYQAAKPIRHIPHKADIEFRHLSFAYPGQERKILSDINLHIEGGSFIGLTGPVGAGKSTLFRLLNREYEIPEGMLFIGGHDIHQYRLDAFHQQIVTVEQLPFLFSRSIQENIKFGRQDAEPFEVEEAAYLANLHEDIIEFPLNYETVVGERGVSLSGGQRQRIAIARAFLVNRSILLLDDIFSAVDTKTENKIFESLIKKYKGKTVVLITHRVSILEQLDRVIYMVDGCIKEDGTPADLGARKGLYSALVELQKMQEIKTSS